MTSLLKLTSQLGVFLTCQSSAAGRSRFISFTNENIIIENSTGVIEMSSGCTHAEEIVLCKVNAVCKTEQVFDDGV